MRALIGFLVFAAWCLNVAPHADGQALETATYPAAPTFGKKDTPMTEHVNWPPEYAPDRSPIHAVNEIDIAAPPSKVWALLVGAPHWSEYYQNASNVHVAGGSTTLSMDTRFAWTTAGIELKSQVREFVPETRLAWDALSEGGKAYHTWLITPTQVGCHVRTEETQQGPLWIENDRTHPGGLHKVHQIWIEALKAAAEER